MIVKKTVAIVNDTTTEYPDELVAALSDLFQEHNIRLTLDEDNADLLVKCEGDEYDYILTLWINRDMFHD